MKLLIPVHKNFAQPRYKLHIGNRLPVFFIVALFIPLTFFTASFWADDQDGVNFLMGIDLYSIQFHQPHFPGYPLYIAICKALKLLAGISAEKSAVIISILSAAGVLVIVFFMTEKRYGLTIAFISALSLAVHPLFFEFSHKIFSEMPALFLLLCGVYSLNEPLSAICNSNLQSKMTTRKQGRGDEAVQLVRRGADDEGVTLNANWNKRWFLSMFCFGLMLGIRLSWWPFVLFYFISGVRNKNIFPVLCAAIGAILCWLIPLIWVVGFWDFYVEGVSFIYGHFYDWGGAVSSLNAHESRLLLILKRILEVLGCKTGEFNLFLAPWALIQVFAIFCFIYLKEKPKEINHYFMAATLYLVWVILGQNLEKGRHFMPLIPLVILMTASTIYRLPKVIFMILILSFAGRVTEYSGRLFYTPPAVRFSEWLNKTGGVTRNFYCGSSERFFDRYPAVYDNIVSVKNLEELDLKIKSSLGGNSDLFICDDIFGVNFLQKANLVVTFPARYGDPVDRPLRIYKLSNKN